MRILDRKLLRDLWHQRGQSLATALVLGCGIAVFVMTLGTIASLEETRDAYYERYRFADVFARLTRAPERLAGKIADLPGVAAVATRIVKEVTLDVAGFDEPVVGRLISVPPHGRAHVNALVLRQGRWLAPDRTDETLLGEAFAEAHKLVPGDRLGAIINGRRRELVVAGIVLSPEYVYAVAPGTILPDDKRFGVLWMGRDVLGRAFDLDGAFNDVSLTLAPEADGVAVIERLDRLLDPYGGTGAVARADQISNWFLSGEIKQLKIMAGTLPAVFLGVAIFLLNMASRRLVASEREQIGLLKAFGYDDREIGWHYFKMVLAVVVLGLALGLVAGAWLGQGMTALYTQFYRFPFLYYRPGAGVFAFAALISLGAAALAASGAVHRAVALPPAEAMRPPAPTLYRRRAWRRGRRRAFFDQPTMMILRHLGRWPLRGALAALGIAGATAVLLTAVQWIDSIDRLLEVEFFEARRQDLTVTLSEIHGDRALHELARLPGVLKVEPLRAVSVKFRFGQRERRGTIIGVAPDAELERILDVNGRAIAVPRSGLMIATKLGELLGVEPGDRLTVAATEGRRRVREVIIAGSFETYIGTPAYMDRAALDRLMGDGPTITAANLRADSRALPTLYRALKTLPDIAGIALRKAMVETFRGTLAQTLYIMIDFYVLFAGLLAFGVVYNAARIALSERGRELASLRVLGFSRVEVAYVLLGELALLTLAALPLGAGLGYALSWLINLSLDTELYRLPLVITPASYGIAMAVTLVAAAASGVVVWRRIGRLDLVAVLKTRE